MNSETDTLFTFVWKIENCRMDFSHEFRSPKFSIEKMYNTMWDLEFSLLSYKETFQCALQRYGTSEGPDEMKISFKIVLSDTPYELINFENKQTEMFLRGSSIFYNNLSWNKDLWFRSSEFIYVICLMSLDKDEFATYLATPIHSCVGKPFQENLQELRESKFFQFSNSCFARTVVPVEKKKFIWAMNDILTNYNYNYIFHAEKGKCLSPLSQIPDLLIKLCITKENAIIMTIQGKEIKPPYCTELLYTLWILDSEERLRCSEECFCYIRNEDSISELVLDSKNMPRCDLEECFLCLEIKITTGEKLVWIENTSPATYHKINAPCDNQTIDNLQIKMENMYMSKLFCDVTFKLPQKQLKAHKAVLCNNSPVFRAMFENNMQETETNVVVIDDMNEDTMNRLLKFMYSDILEDTQFEDTVKLYEAADKYQIMPLRKKIALNLKSNITLENSFQLFSLAEAHGDKKLKASVFNFIVLHIRQVMLLKDWKEFSNNNTFLVKDILEKVCMRYTFI